jgi:hypothetical protein
LKGSPDDETRRVLLALAIGDLTVVNDYYVVVFLNTKGPDPSAAPEGAGFASGFAFFCEPGNDRPEMACPIDPKAEIRTQFDITSTLDKLAGPSDGMTVTLALVPLRDSLDATRSLTVKSAELSLVTSVVKIAS